MKMNKSDSVQYLVDKSKELDIYNIAKFAFYKYGFETCTAAAKSTGHHYGNGGLLEHTIEVLQLCLRNNEYFKTIGKGVDDKLVFLTALFHDIGKVEDYEEYWDDEKKSNEWRGTDHKNKIHHITRSVLIWQEASKRLEQSERDEVIHAMLAHHGQRAWGSPVEPQTRLAWLLHTCDHMSARMDDCYKKNVRT